MGDAEAAEFLESRALVSRDLLAPSTAVTLSAAPWR